MQNHYKLSAVGKMYSKDQSNYLFLYNVLVNILLHCPSAFRFFFKFKHFPLYFQHSNCFLFQTVTLMCNESAVTTAVTKQQFNSDPVDLYTMFLHAFALMMP